MVHKELKTLNFGDGNIYHPLPIVDAGGKEWNISNLKDIFECVYYDNGIWVAGSKNNGLYYSTDGMTWTRSNNTSNTFNCVYYDNGIWVAGSDSNKGLYYSTDGMTWTQSNITSGDFRCVYNANDIWVAGSSSVNGAYYSTSDAGKVLTVDSAGEWVTKELRTITETNDGHGNITIKIGG